MIRSLSKKPLLVASHLVALGLGAWWASQPPGDQNETEEITTPDSRSASHSPGYRISTDRLLDSLQFDSPHYNEVFPKEEHLRKPPPEERAALITDFAGELQAHVDRFNQTGLTDYRFTQAIISRWMSVDPEAAMLFVGQIKLRSGWGDPWPALFAKPCGLNASQLFSIIQDSWHPYNRKRGLKALAPTMGTHGISHLPDLLTNLEARDAQNFYSDAVHYAKPGDLNTWLESIACLPSTGQDKAFGALTAALIPSKIPATWLNPKTHHRGPVPPTIEELKAFVSEQADTPVGEILNKRLDALLLKYNETINAPPPPKTKPTLSRGGTGTGSLHWLKSENAREFQQVFTGQTSLPSVLKNQMAVIENQLSEQSQDEAIGYLIREAFSINPEQTLAFSDGKIPPKLIRKALDDSFEELNARYTPQRTAAIYSTVFNTPHWKNTDSNHHQLVRFINDFHEHHSGLARKWIQSIPPEVIDDLKSSKNYGSYARRTLEEALTK